MPLRLYNTLTRQKVPFKPLDPSSVRLYACGPTVYDHLHIGNGRMLIVFDVLFRLLRHVYGEAHVKYVRNITDVDDKINARAAERGVDIRVLTDEMTKVFHEDAKALGCLAPTVEPRATDHIAEMIAMIDKLIAKGHAYVAAGHNSGDCHVLFDVPSMPAYGKLSKRPLDEMIAGARVEVAPYKRGPMDFVLWKPSNSGEPGWESPWGRGRPGWHIECSAMSWKHLGETFDIHGGGIDLLFPHHENEMAQSCSAFGHDIMANVWMHNGHLQVESEKMSKSLGNFVTIRELLTTDKFGGKSWTGEVLRLAILRTHYRQPLDFTVKALEEAEKTLDKWYPSKGYEDIDGPLPQTNDPKESEDEAFVAALKDDLNTPRALANLYELYSQTRGPTSGYPQIQLKRKFTRSARLLGLLTMKTALHYRLDAETGRSGLKGGAATLEKHEVNVPLERVTALRDARAAARAAKNWPEADRIRDELTKMGITLQDNPDGTTTLHYHLVGETGRYELRGSAATLEVKR
ncbi:MAG: cysteine--tRNA ligase [Methylocella sp.]